jgi:hypothetical protein
MPVRVLRLGNIHGFRSRVSLVAAAAAVAVVLAACGGSSVSSSTYKQAVERAVNASLTADGYSANFIVAEKVTHGATVTTRAWAGSGSYGHLPYGDLVHLTIQTPASPRARRDLHLQTEAASFGRTFFIALTPSVRAVLPVRAAAALVGKRWLEFTDSFQPRQTEAPWLLAIVDAVSVPARLLNRVADVSEVTKLDTSRLDGVLTTEYRTELALAVGRCGTGAAALSPACRRLKAEEAAEAPGRHFEVWIDHAGLVRRIARMIVEKLGLFSVTLTQSLTFNSYRAQPTLVVPAPAQTVQLSTLLKLGH